MPIIKDISALQPMVAQKAIQFAKLCEEAGIHIIFTETLREEMTALIYAFQGRFDAEDLKMNPNLYKELARLRKKYKLWELSDAQIRQRITWTLESKHKDGNAFDIVPIKDGTAWWDAPDTIWEQIGKIGESLGLIWGGRWPKPDRPHFEYRSI